MVKACVYIMFVVIIGIFSFSAGEYYSEREEEIKTEKLAVSEENTPEIIKEEMSFQTEEASLPDVLDNVLPTVVGITAISEDLNKGETVSMGSGVILSDMGYIVTNQHVVGESPKRIDVTLFDGSVEEGKLCWSDKSLDVAVVKIEGFIDTVAKIGESRNVRVGEDVFAIGNPLSLQFERSVTKGIISAVNRTISITVGDDLIYMEDLIQTDASINPGNSGGPLMNLKGEVIGINTIRVQSAEGMGFAVPINICESVIRSLETTGEFKTPYLGLYAYTSQMAKYLKKEKDNNEGLFVISLDREGPAYESGIRYGDAISEINDTPINTMLALRRELFKLKPGDSVYLTVISKGRVRRVEVICGDMTESGGGSNQ